MRYLLTICFVILAMQCATSRTPSTDTSYKKEMQLIFNEFVGSEDHVDSYSNKQVMRNGFLHFSQNPTKAPWQLLLNIWMYYDATDFDGIPLLETLFENNKKAVIKAIEYRQKHAFKWESKDSSPFTDLEKLKQQLSITKSS